MYLCSLCDSPPVDRQSKLVFRLFRLWTDPFGRRRKDIIGEVPVCKDCHRKLEADPGAYPEMCRKADERAARMERENLQRAADNAAALSPPPIPPPVVVNTPAPVVRLMPVVRK